PKIVHPAMGLKEARQAKTRGVLQIAHTWTGIPSELGARRVGVKEGDRIARPRPWNYAHCTARIGKRSREDFSGRIVARNPEALLSAEAIRVGRSPCLIDLRANWWMVRNSVQVHQVAARLLTGTGRNKRPAILHQRLIVLRHIAAVTARAFP